MAATVPTIGRVAKAATSNAVLDFLKKPKQPLIGASGFRQVCTVRSKSTTRLRYVGSAIDPPNVRADSEQDRRKRDTFADSKRCQQPVRRILRFSKQEAALDRPQSITIPLESSDGQRDTHQCTAADNFCRPSPNDFRVLH